MTDQTSALGWVNGWQRRGGRWQLQGLVRRGRAWESQLLDPAVLAPKRRVFEPGAAPYAQMRSRSFPVHIPDLSLAAPLLHPGDLLGAVVSGARRTRHAVYAVEAHGQTVYLSALLVLQELWAWTAGAVEALLVPNGLAMSLQVEEAEGELTVHVTGPLARLARSDTTLRRLCWLAQCEEARASWSSVLTFAHRGALQLRLPRVAVDAWAWGVELPTGCLVAELSAVTLDFVLPQPVCWVQFGQSRFPCPAPPERRTGLVSL